MIIENPQVFRSSIAKSFVLHIGNIERSSRVEHEIYLMSSSEAKSRKVYVDWNNPFFVQLYIDKLRTFFVNTKNNSEYLASIRESTDDEIASIVKMTHYEINPNRWKPLIFFFSFLFFKKMILNASIMLTILLLHFFTGTSYEDQYISLIKEIIKEALIRCPEFKIVSTDDTLNTLLMKLHKMEDLKIYIFSDSNIKKCLFEENHKSSQFLYI